MKSRCLRAMGLSLSVSAFAAGAEGQISVQPLNGTLSIVGNSTVSLGVRVDYVNAATGQFLFAGNPRPFTSGTFGGGGSTGGGIQPLDGVSFSSFIGVHPLASLDPSGQRVSIGFSISRTVQVTRVGTPFEYLPGIMAQAVLREGSVTSSAIGTWEFVVGGTEMLPFSLRDQDDQIISSGGAFGVGAVGDGASIVDGKLSPGRYRLSLSGGAFVDMMQADPFESVGQVRLVIVPSPTSGVLACAAGVVCMTTRRRRTAG